MALYHFHTDDGRSTFDDEGLELPDDRAAKMEAARLFGELVRDQPEQFWASSELRLTVTDAARLVLFELDLTARECPAMRTSRRA